MSERPAKKAKVTGRSRPRRGVTRMTGGTSSASSGDALFNIYSGGNYRQATTTVYHATDDDKETDRQTATPSTIQPTEQLQDIEAMNDLNRDVDNDWDGPEEEMEPTSARRSGKVCGHSRDIIPP